MPKLGGRREPAAARALVEHSDPSDAFRASKSLPQSVLNSPGPDQIVHDVPAVIDPPRTEEFPAAVAGIQPQGAVAAPADQIDWAVDITPKQRQRASVASRCRSGPTAPGRRAAGRGEP
jgi:hypothetical protein